MKRKAILLHFEKETMEGIVRINSSYYDIRLPISGSFVKNYEEKMSKYKPGDEIEVETEEPLLEHSIVKISL